MLRNFLTLGFATGLRICSGFLLFVFAARSWGAEGFGEFMYLFSVATIVTMISEYGFSLQILREVGKSKERAPTVLGELLGAKIWLTSAALLIVLVYSLVKGYEQRIVAIVILLTLSATINSYSDFLLAAYRALGRFSQEATVTFWGSSTYFIAGSLAVFFGGTGLMLAAAMVMSRLIGLGLVVRELYGHLNEVFYPTLAFNRAWQAIKRGFSYGTDAAVATTFANIDTILVSSTLGYSAAGIYQAGARFYQGASMVAPIFGSLYLPKMSRAEANRTALTMLHRSLSYQMLTASLMMAILFIVAAPYVRLIYPTESFKTVEVIFPWLGVLLFVRFTAAAQGISITALGGQRFRAWLFLSALALLIVSASILLGQFGITGMIGAMVLSYAYLAIGFALWAFRKGISQTSQIVAIPLLPIICWLAWMQNRSGNIFG
jgi:O-antigen/teichoic acid export membrane protein